MPRKVLPRITNVQAGAKPMSLRVRWDTGADSEIDISGMIETYRVYAPLRQSPDLFQQVRLGDYGTDVIWTDEIDMSADTLWRLAQEQSGATMSAEEFHAWRVGNAFTLDTAAQALGISRRTVAYYEAGEQAIPRYVMLATRWLAEAAKAQSAHKTRRVRELA
jgi:DNA-binding XRE family transcriptional regulator